MASRALDDPVPPATPSSVNWQQFAKLKFVLPRHQSPNAVLSFAHWLARYSRTRLVAACSLAQQLDELTRVYTYNPKYHGYKRGAKVKFLPPTPEPAALDFLANVKTAEDMAAVPATLRLLVQSGLTSIGEPHSDALVAAAVRTGTTATVCMTLLRHRAHYRVFPSLASYEALLAALLAPAAPQPRLAAEVLQWALHDGVTPSAQALERLVAALDAAGADPAAREVATTAASLGAR